MLSRKAKTLQFLNRKNFNNKCREMKLGLTLWWKIEETGDKRFQTFKIELMSLTFLLLFFSSSQLMRNLGSFATIYFIRNISEKRDK